MKRSALAASVLGYVPIILGLECPDSPECSECSHLVQVTASLNDFNSTAEP